MSAISPTPNRNLLLLAALGIGAYWLMRRGAVAAPAVPIGRSNAPAGGYGGTGVYSAPNVGAGVLNAVARFFGGTGATQTNAPGTYDGRAAAPWNTAGATADDGSIVPSAAGGASNNPSAWLASTANDGAVINPPNQDPWDYMNGLIVN